MRGVDRYDQMIKYYSFTRKTMKWTKKVMLYFVQMMLKNAHVLYNKYNPAGQKMTLLQFHELAYRALIHFDPDEWPESDTEIPHLPSLPLEERIDYRPPAAENAPPSDEDNPDSPEALEPATATPGTSVDTPGSTVPAATPAPEEEDVDQETPLPGTANTPAYSRPRLFDPPGRLSAGRTIHTSERHTGQTKMKRCRVCFKSGIRRETIYQCCVCKVPLCIRNDCFRRYHSLKRYWR